MARALGPLFDDPRMGTMPEDPWASMFPWGLESLAWVRHPRGREVALRVLADDTERSVRLAALLALREYPLDAEVLAATRGLLTSREAELRGAAALVLRRADERVLRVKAESVLVQRVARPGRHDADWYAVVETLGGDDAAVDRWIKVWSSTKVRDVRGRLVRALMTSVYGRGDAALEALTALRMRCPTALARTLLAHWKRDRGLRD